VFFSKTMDRGRGKKSELSHPGVIGHAYSEGETALIVIAIGPPLSSAPARL
jgi:hypothetical protein